MGTTIHMPSPRNSESLNNHCPYGQQATGPSFTFYLTYIKIMMHSHDETVKTQRQL